MPQPTPTPAAAPLLRPDDFFSTEAGTVVEVGVTVADVVAGTVLPEVCDGDVVAVADAVVVAVPTVVVLKRARLIGIVSPSTALGWFVHADCIASRTRNPSAGDLGETTTQAIVTYNFPRPPIPSQPEGTTHTLPRTV